MSLSLVPPLAERPPPRVVTYKLLPHQAAAYRSRHRFVALLAGLGSGKTDVGTLWLLTRMQQSPPGVRFMVASNTYTQLFDATLHSLYANLNRLSVPVLPRELPRAKAPTDIRIWAGRERGWCDVLCRSLEVPERIHGPEYGGIWIDEASFSKHEGFKVANDRLRDKRGSQQMLITSTKDDPAQSWLYEQFVERFDPSTARVIEAKTTDNPYLPADYCEVQAQIRSASEYARLIENKWVSNAGGEIYTAFDRGLHESAELAAYDAALPVHWWLDFNIGEGKPMSSCLAQIKKGPSWKTGKIRPFVSVFDELILDSTDTRDLVQEAAEREGIRGRDPKEVRICGDASGRARDTRSKTSDYGILTDAGFINQDVPRSNPPIRERHNTVNALLQSAEGDVRVAIHPRCATLLRGLETGRLRKGAHYLEAETREQHVTTAFGYGLCRNFELGGPKIEQGRL